jgi:hypothetical protein
MALLCLIIPSLLVSEINWVVVAGTPCIRHRA